MILTPLADYGDKLHGLTDAGEAELVAVTDDQDEARALAAVAERPSVIEHPTHNRYGVWRVFTLRRKAGDRR